jgi:hypothetical protein
MEIPPHLQDRTNDLLLELESELGKDAANQFILIRSAIYYGDNGLPGIDPQVVMGPGSPNGDDSWKHAFTQNSDYSPGNVSISSNHDLDEILDASLTQRGASVTGLALLWMTRVPTLKLTRTSPCASAVTARSVGSSRSVPNERGGKRASLETVARLFPRPDLINILDKYWGR